MQGGTGILVAGRYLLSEAVGQGGMGRVWRGHDQLLDRVVAVKEVILPPQAPEQHAELLTRTMREARAAARLDHPGVITIHDVVEHEGSPWIVMQYVSGESLRTRLDRCGRLPWQEAVGIGEQVADALVAAHAARIVHRDLKPDNILLSGRRVIVTDFGIARIIDATTQLTGTGILVGTPAYMAPELLDGGSPGPAGDLWALGATLYTAVEGTPPFNGPNMTALMAAILTRPPAQPRHAGPLLEILSALLDKNPARRHDAQAAARALAACRLGQAVTDPTPDVQPSPAGTAVNSGPPHQPTAAATPRNGQATQFRDTLTGRWHSPDGSGVPPLPPGRVLATGKVRRWPRTRSLLAVTATAATAAVVGALLGQPGGSQSPGPASSTRASSARSAARTGSPASSGPATASLVATLTDPTSSGWHEVDAVAFGPGNILAVGDGNGSIYLWNTATQSVAATLTDPNGGAPTHLTFGPNGMLATADLTSTSVWNSATRSLVTTLVDPGGGLAESAAFGPDSILAVGDVSGSTYLWSTSTWKITATLTAPGHFAASSVAFGPNGTLAGGDYTNADANPNTYLWSTSTKKVIATLTDPGGTRVQTLAYGPDGALAVVDADGSTYLWNTTTRNLTATLPSQGATPLAVAFGPDRTLAVGQTNGQTLLWNTATRKVIATLTDPKGHFVDAVAFGPDNTLAVGDSNGKTYLWHISNGKP